MSFKKVGNECDNKNNIALAVMVTSIKQKIYTARVFRQ